MCEDGIMLIRKEGEKEKERGRERDIYREKQRVRIGDRKKHFSKLYIFIL